MLSEYRDVFAWSYDDMKGLDDEELERYSEENPRIVPLFEIDVRGTTNSYVVPNAITGQEDELGENV